MAATKAHVVDAAVQQAGCNALRFLLKFHGENSRCIAEESGIGAIVAAMQAKIDDAVVQKAGCDTLRCLAGANVEKTVAVLWRRAAQRR